MIHLPLFAKRYFPVLMHRHTVSGTVHTNCQHRAFIDERLLIADDERAVLKEPVRPFPVSSLMNRAFGKVKR